jgi:alkylation response protein AidB-like acyl-CoA dehydrogenase
MSAATVIAGDAEALAVAAELAADFRKDAAERDARRRLPHAEVERLSASGLLAVTVPAEFGGPDVGAETLAEIFRLPAAAGLAQIAQSHFVYVKHVQDIRTRLARRSDGSYVLDGVKHYSTGALFADRIPVLARTDDDNLHVAYVPRDAPASRSWTTGTAWGSAPPPAGPSAWSRCPSQPTG